jgi:hypothetical protein
MAPVEMAFMAIVIPAWETKLMIDTPLPVMYSCSQTGPLAGLRANRKQWLKTPLKLNTWL